NETANVVVRTGKREAVPEDGDAVTRSCLAGDCDIRFGSVTGGLGMDDAADVKNDWSAGNTYCLTERARAGIVEIGDMINGPTAPTGRKTAKTFGARKGRQLS